MQISKICVVASIICISGGWRSTSIQVSVLRIGRMDNRLSVTHANARSEQLIILDLCKLVSALVRKEKD